MKFFKLQSSLDFEQAIWDNDPELLVMDQVLEQNPKILKIAAECFPNAHSETQAKVGRSGMSLEQIVRAAIYQRHKRLTFRELSNHTEDSKKGRSFMKMEINQYFSHQTLQENISKINSEVLEKIHVAISKYAIKLGVDDGQKIRTDSTAIKTNIHYPTNASLLWDCIRVSCRILKEIKKLLPEIKFRNYQKFGKKLLFKIVNTKGKDNRRPLFEKMLHFQKRCEHQVENAIDVLSSYAFGDETQEKQREQYLQDLEALLPKMQKVSDVSYRNEIRNEDVPAKDKLFSIFEDHTDCIKKGGRETIFGHKINLTSGKSNFIFDCVQPRGNPADINFFPETLDNLSVNFDIVPRDIATDGGYASKDNLDDAKARGIINIVFNKVKGTMQNVASSKKMETMLKKWRSGMEAVISNFKRGLNAGKCTWKGWEAFKCYVLWSLITFNMRVIAKWIIDKIA